MASVNWTYNNSKKMALHPKFARGEVVWAKLTGYPWWPGAIVEVEEDQEDGLASTCIVKFFGEDSHSVLPLAKLAKYAECYSEYSKKSSGNKKLKEAMRIAQNAVNGRLSVQKQLDRVKVTLASSKSQRNPMKTATSIEDHSSKELCEIQTAETSFCPSAQPLKEKKEMVLELEQQEQRELQFDSNDQQVLEELEREGLDQSNVIDVLEYGLIRRLALVDREKAEEMKRKARKMLVRKYFSKLSSKRVPEKQAQTQVQEDPANSQTLPTPPKTKKIHKSPKEIRLQKAMSEIESLCVKRLYSILKTYELGSEESRKISVYVVQKLRGKYQIDSPWFQKSYLSFIEAVKERSESRASVLTYCDNYYQGWALKTLSESTDVSRFNKVI